MNRKQRRQNQNKREAVRLAAIHKEATQAGMHASWMMLAASCLEARRLYRFGRKRLERMVHTAHQFVFDALSAQELIEQLKQETGIDLESVYSEGEEAILRVKQAPTIEAEPVQHFEWIDMYGGWHGD